MKRIALIVVTVLVLQGCGPLPVWVRSALNQVISPAHGTGVVPVPDEAETLSCAILVRRPAGGNRYTRAVILDQEWKKYAKFFGKLCSWPAAVQNKTLPVFKEGTSQGPTSPNPLIVTYLIETNPQVEAGSGLLVVGGTLTVSLETTVKWNHAHIQAWGANQSLAIVIP